MNLKPHILFQAPRYIVGSPFFFSFSGAPPPFLRAFHFRVFPTLWEPGTGYKPQHQSRDFLTFAICGNYRKTVMLRRAILHPERHRLLRVCPFLKSISKFVVLAEAQGILRRDHSCTDVSRHVFICTIISFTEVRSTFCTSYIIFE